MDVLRTVRGGGGSSRCGCPNCLVHKASDALNFMVCPHGQREWINFLQTSFVDDPFQANYYFWRVSNAFGFATDLLDKCLALPINTLFS